MSHFTKLMLAALTAPTFAVVASAQVTTSAINGSVVDEKNEPVIGATITAVHNPSGSRYRAVTNKDGRYTIQGMRTGGPYTVTVSYLGYGTKQYEKLYLELGNSLPINVQLKPKDNDLAEATVTVERKQKGGAAKNFSLQNITSTPTIDRSVQDIVKNSPMVTPNKVGGITIAGVNNRYNSFQIDGTVANDVFGLTANGMNGGQAGANPISMDAIQELQVVVAPFDVRQSGFTGGAINAVTKQGTNEFHGSAYGYYNNQKMYGKYDASRDYKKSPMTDQYNRTFGGTFGGAFIKDKLFFFVSAEGRKESYPSSYGPGYSNKYITTETAQQIADKYAQYTGVTDNFGSRNIDTKSFGLLARIDWNINENNKFAIRYQLNNANKDTWATGSKKYYFNNSGYRFFDKTNSIVAELNSRIGDKFYNEFRASATYVRDHREAGNEGPSIIIKNVKAADEVTNISAYIGTEQYSGANRLDQDVYTIENNLSYYTGQHTLTFGTHNEFYKIANLFMANATGYYGFNTLDDFMNDKPNAFGYTYSDKNLTGSLRYAPAMKTGQLGFYAQDKWTLNSAFNLTYGLRIDLPMFFNKPTTNVDFNRFAAQNNLGVKVGETPSVKVLVSPRVGFNWYADSEHKTLIRGGLGIFTGRVPFVWMSNAYNNNGIEVKHYNLSKGNLPTIGNSLNNLEETTKTLTAASEEINTIAKNFKFPQVLRANLAVEQKLPGDVKMTLEGVYSKNINQAFFENLAVTRNENDYVYAIPGVETSAAPYYHYITGSAYSNIINIKNTNKGYSYALTASLQKDFEFGLGINASYTFGHSKSVNDCTSSQAYSNWKYNYSIDTNAKNELGWSKFDIPHRIMIALNYNSPKYLNGLMSTSFSIIYNGTSGGRYSLTMNESKDFNGDGYRGNSLLYIPTDAELALMNFADVKDKNGNVTMTAAENRESFKQWIEADDYAKNHRGQYAERNSNRTPWENEVNLHFGQSFYAKNLGKLEFTFDITNFANMLNKKWGTQYGNAYNVSPVSVTGISTTQGANGNTIATPTYTYNANSNPSAAPILSRWHCQVGLRLTF